MLSWSHDKKLIFLDFYEFGMQIRGGGGQNVVSTTGLRKQARACVRRLLFAYTES